MGLLAGADPKGQGLSRNSSKKKDLSASFQPPILRWRWLILRVEVVSIVGLIGSRRSLLRRGFLRAIRVWRRFGRWRFGFRLLLGHGLPFSLGRLCHLLPSLFIEDVVRTLTGLIPLDGFTQSIDRVGIDCYGNGGPGNGHQFLWHRDGSEGVRGLIGNTVMLACRLGGGTGEDIAVGQSRSGSYRRALLRLVFWMGVSIVLGADLLPIKPGVGRHHVPVKVEMPVAGGVVTLRGNLRFQIRPAHAPAHSRWIDPYVAAGLARA
jgi:hypothetical protein